MARAKRKSQVQASVKPCTHSGTKGRPLLYSASYMCRTAKMLSGQYGFTLKELSKVFGIATITIKKYMVAYPEFKEAVISGRNEFDSNVVERKLLELAAGYTYQEKTISVVHDKFGNPHENETISIKEHAPNIQAATFWLCNRAPERYSFKPCQ